MTKLRTDTCPTCNSEWVEGSSIEVDVHGATQECWCKDCGAVWVLKFQAVEKLLIDAELPPEDDAEVDALLKSAEDDGTVTGGGHY